MEDIDYSQLTPGIRETVRWLRGEGFETTDSGDGVTNVEAGMEGAMDIPMVAAVVAPEKMISEAHRLHQLVLGKGLTDAQVEATYWPGSGTAIVLLLGVSDAHLKHNV